MFRITCSPLAAVSCSLLLACSTADSPETTQAGAGAQAGTSGKAGAAGQRAAADSGGHAAGHAGDAGAGGSAGAKSTAGAGGQAAETLNIARAMIAPDTAPAIAAADYASFVQHLNEFGLELGQKQAAANEVTQQNSVYSPLSASYALAMTYAGARGKTANEMQKVLGDSFAPGVFHKGENKLARELASRVRTGKDNEGVTRKIELKLADALFVENTLALEPTFLETMARDYDSGVHREDFMHAFEPARTQINAWVADQTHDRIQNLLVPDSIDSFTRLVLVNTLYFYGSWLDPFSQRGTSDSDFHTLAGANVSVPTMHDQQHLDYGTGADYALAELPYEGGELRMTIVLPAQDKFESVRAQATSTWLDKATTGLANKTVNIALPKWKLTSGTFSLKQALQELGMQTAFTDAADFSGLSKDGPLTLSNVLQKAFIAVDELGTEAAAATAAIVAGSSAPIEVIDFTVNRPFLFFIRDQSGAVLFSGHVVDPSEAAP